MYLTMMDPPYYILLSSQPANSTSLRHPTIQYQYADDSPLALLPQHPEEHVLLFEYDENASVTVTSTSRSMTVTGIKAEEAPGAAVAEDTHNDRMYILEIEATTQPGEDKLNHERPSPRAVVAQFKQRNLAIRRALNYPENSKSTALTTVS
ncbi:hypothetical protein BDP27DRAFT_1327851 [Rhodocollybia butyracea]|uniref:Uncharacterized protein n=1 Tax=Rhodocollybia butyracea TaxID=206335 RepID=A0A9P5PLJ1_9AGAR|nr:hypothetical protein BDP27DRAFT_1327851 [Rhodocollybia butyracea]